MLAVRQQVSGVAVPQIVEPDAQFSLLRHSAEVAGHDVVQVQRLPVRLAKNQTEIGVRTAHLPRAATAPTVTQERRAASDLAHRHTYEEGQRWQGIVKQSERTTRPGTWWLRLGRRNSSS